MSTHSSLSSRLAPMLTGCTTTLPPAVSILIAGQSTAQPAIVQTLQGYAAADKKVADAKLAYDQSILDRDANTKSAGAFLDDLSVGLKAHYGATNPVLANFGVPVKRPPAKLPAEKLVMKAARNEATRTARGTKGPKQKKGIRGFVADPPPPPANPPPPPANPPPPPANPPPPPAGTGTPTNKT